MSNKIGNAIFDGLAKQMLLDFDQIRKEITHKGERGTQQEETLKGFLSKYLPKKYGVGSGEIINPFDQVSRQCDIVIYNALESPLLLIREGYQLFPIESVLATIEVKSSVNTRSIVEIVDNISSIQKLYLEEKEKIPFCCFFSYKTDFSGDEKSRKTAEHFAKYCKDLPPAVFFDLGCILDSGLFYNFDMENKGGIGYIITDTTPAQNLCSFFLNLLFVLDSSEKHYLQKYFEFELPTITIAPF